MNCSECDRPHYSKGFCRRHYRKWVKYGDPHAGRPEYTTHGEIPAWVDTILAQPWPVCIDWPYSLYTNGRGQWGDRNAAARVCEMAHGLKPTSRHQAAHTCGRYICVNPRHLYWATPEENEADKVGHGTVRLGDDHHNAKLTEDQVRDIFRSTEPQRTLAARYGVSQYAIGCIKRRQTWRHVTWDS